MRLLVLGCAGCALVAACTATLRVKGSEPREPRPALEALAPAAAEYQVWVIVPSLRVHTYPQPGKNQQPMLQFAADVDDLALGRAGLTLLVAPDGYADGEEVRYFEDKVLWSGRLRAGDRRRFTLWVRENNRSAPTRFDQKLVQVERVAEIIEELSGAGGFKIPAQRAIRISVQAFKELQQDWLILRWSCPWRHVLDSAQRRFTDSALSSTVLRARLVSAEQARGRPVAELEVLFVVRRRERPLWPGGLQVE